ncbi:hypothetical protein COCON_G00151670, partial [Conger conger]
GSLGYLPRRTKSQAYKVKGALCILLCVACSLYKKNQKTKKVEPDPERPGKNMIMEEKGTQKKFQIWACGQGTRPLRDSRIRGRAQSAGAQLSTCEFSRQSFKTENEGCLDQTGRYISMPEVDNTQQQETGRPSMPVHRAENLPYLSIGANAADRSPGCTEDHCGDNPGHNLRKEIRRISTWPITLNQWKKQHTSEDKSLSLFLSTTEDRGKMICDVDECMDGFKQEDLSLESPPRDNVEGVLPMTDREFTAEEDSRSATQEGDTVLLCLNEEPQSHTWPYEISTRKSHVPGQTWNQTEPHDEHDEPYSPSLKLGREWEMEREARATCGMARQEGCGFSTGGSWANNPGSSPHDAQ